MADKEEKTNITAPDPQAAAVEPIAPKGPEEDAAFVIDIDEADRKDESSDIDEKKGRPELRLTRSRATGTSVATTTANRQPESKPWYKTPNPLRWGGIPPVPAERAVSREYQAGFFSQMTFQWMAPLMNVSEPLSQCD